MLESLDTLIVFVLALLAGHFLMDYPLQGDFLSRAKNSKNPITGINPQFCMDAHCWLHGAMVWIITGSLTLGMTEYLLHMVIDRIKCRGWISFTTDQLLHFACKIAWAIILVFVSHEYLGMVKFPVLGL